MKIIIFLIVIMITVSCNVMNPETKLNEMESPIILVGKSEKNDIILKDANGIYKSFNSDYHLTHSIHNSYNVGDTIK